jgi:hypothetical protein
MSKQNCHHCQSGFLENQFGQDVECVNGVLIDIDVANEGWQSDVCYPVAPCHPGWDAQSRDEDFDNDCQKRLREWAGLTDPEEHPAAAEADAIERRAERFAREG